MYTIKEAAARTGLSVPTIRVWERRYGVVSPTRTPAGYRLYDDDSIERLQVMRQLIEREGWRPSQAAERVRAAGSDLSRLAGRPTGRWQQPAGVAPAVAGTAVATGAIAAMVEACRSLDIASIERLLDESFAAQRFEAAMDQVVFPALHAIGDEWASGKLDPAREHAASETIRRRLARYYDAAARADGGPTVVVGLPPRSQHELGAFAFAVAARRAALDVLYLGANVPVDGWIRTVLEAEPTVVVIAVATSEDVASAASVVTALRSAGATAAIAVGGPVAGEVPSDEAIVRLSGSIEAAVDSVVRLVERGPATGGVSKLR